jgi:hypothetical protein
MNRVADADIGVNWKILALSERVFVLIATAIS